MAQRKTVVSTRASLANLITRLEGTKHQASVNAIRQAMKRLVQLDAQATLEGKKSPLVMLRREAAGIAHEQRKKAMLKAMKRKKKK